MIVNERDAVPTLGRVLVAVDPGLRGCGVATFYEKVLSNAGYAVGSKDGLNEDAWIPMMKAVVKMVEEHLEVHDLPGVDRLILELPQVYRYEKQKGDPNDLIQLAAVDGGIIGSFSHLLMENAEVKTYLPNAWKAQVKKDIHHARMMKKLSKLEKAQIHSPSKALEHNVLDAVALGLFALGRFKRGGAAHGSWPRTSPELS